MKLKKENLTRLRPPIAAPDGKAPHDAAVSHGVPKAPQAEDPELLRALEEDQEIFGAVAGEKQNQIIAAYKDMLQDTTALEKYLLDAEMGPLILRAVEKIEKITNTGFRA